MTDTSLGVLFEPPAAIVLVPPAGGGSGLMYSGPGRLMGWSAFVGTPGGSSLSTLVGNPAAGVDWSFVVPAGTTLNLQEVIATLATSAAVANRQPMLQVLDTAGRTVYEAPAAGVTAASLTTAYQWGVGLGDTAIVDGVSTTGIPPVTVGPGWTVRTVTAGVQAADQWSAIDLGAGAGSGAVATLVDGLDATGQVVATVGGLVGSTDSDSYTPNGIRLARGLFVVVNTLVTVTAAYVVPEGRGR